MGYNLTNNFSRKAFLMDVGHKFYGNFVLVSDTKSISF